MAQNREKRIEQFGTQLQNHRGAVFGYILRRVGGNPSQAEDMTQDCILRVWERRWRNPPPCGALRTYLLKTAQNLLHACYRRGQIPMPLQDESLSDHHDENPETLYLVRELNERLSAEVATMPLELRETLRLRVEESLDYGAIAARHSCPVGTVKSRLNAARARLQRVYRQYQEGEAATRSVITERCQEHRAETRRIVTITRKEQRMASGEIKEIRSELAQLAERLRVLEGKGKTGEDPADALANRLAGDLMDGRRQKGSAFALGLVHMVTQSAQSGSQGTALGIRTFESASDLPDDGTLQERFERIRALTSDALILKVFRHFFALRFADRPMSVSSVELAEALGATTERVETLLYPLVADRTLTLMPDGKKDGDLVYEWDGNDASINTLLFAMT